jgi:hypothetical protein
MIGQIPQSKIQELGSHSPTLVLLINYEADDGCDILRSWRKRYKIPKAIGRHPANDLALDKGNIALHGSIRDAITGPVAIQTFVMFRLSILFPGV